MRLGPVLASLFVLGFAPEARADFDGGVSCRRLTGFAVGLVHAPGTWERLGKRPTFPSFSPILGGGCGLDLGPASLIVGTEAQFTYVHYDQDKNLTSGWLTASAALLGGTDEWRGGVHLMGTPIPVGAGLTVDWLPGNPRGARDGLEARMTMYWVEQPNLQLMLLYVVTTPRFP